MADLPATAPKRQAPGCRDRDQALAVTIAVLLLTGSVLLVSCWIGPLATFTSTAVLVVTAYAAPGLVRRIAIRRAVRQLLRGL
ncbi:hypothetical protein ABZ770_39930 [Streptomyces sp. NPDC006654]|uniref:hypothetical protein n=1 Tax=Streptomyces sp. NPDC006654 TaxID=3156897 RepID=UPI0033FAC59D